MSKLAWIGTGVMGKNMVLHLFCDEDQITVYNRTLAKAMPLAQQGATVASSVEEAVRDADFIFTIVGNDEGAVAEKVREYAYDFDPDEHAEMWVESRGKRGVPDSIRTFVDDADAIKEMLFELAQELRKAEEEYRRREEK